MSELIMLRLYLYFLSPLPGWVLGSVGRYMNELCGVKYECGIVDVKFRVLAVI